MIFVESLRNTDGFDAFDKAKVALECCSFRWKELNGKGPWEWCIGIGKEDRDLLKPICDKLNEVISNYNFINAKIWSFHFF